MAQDRRPLPPPVSISEEYLAAVLAELRAIRDQLDQQQPKAPEAGTVVLREPTRKGKRP
jgi:hypothetical protein